MNYTQLKRRRDRAVKKYDQLCNELNDVSARRQALEEQCTAQYARYLDASEDLDAFKALSKRVRGKS